MMLKGVLYQIIHRGENCATVRILPESPIYKAHFPGYPVTPGVTIVQMAMELIGKQLKGAKDIKFTVPIIPSADGPLVRFQWSFKADDVADISVFLPGDELCAKMSVLV